MTTEENAQRRTPNAELQRKVAKAKSVIRAAVEAGQRPAVLSSFGKDSMVLLHLVRDTVKRDVWSTHGFPLPVLYLRDPWFPWKHRFAEQTATSWAMQVHNFPPVATGVKAKGDSGSESERLELVSRYSLGLGYLDIPKNVAGPDDYPRRDYLCGLRDWILRPKAGVSSFPFDVLLHGHKSSDVDNFEGRVPLRSDREKLNDKIDIFFPLETWTDDDVWDYIEQNKTPFDVARYGKRRTPNAEHPMPKAEEEDNWASNDWIHACTACIDPRATEEKVFCPKLKSFVPNVGNKVLQLGGLPDYIVSKSKSEELNLVEVN